MRLDHTIVPSKDKVASAEFFAKVMGLPTKEKDMAFKLLKTMGVKVPSIPTNKVQIAAKIINALGRGIDKARGTGEDMGY